MTQNDPYGNTPLGGEHPAINGPFVHSLCGAEKLHGDEHRTSPTDYAYIL